MIVYGCPSASALQREIRAGADSTLPPRHSKIPVEPIKDSRDDYVPRYDVTSRKDEVLLVFRRCAQEPVEGLLRDLEREHHIVFTVQHDDRNGDVRQEVQRVDLGQWLGVTMNALVSGAVDGDISAIQNDVITAASIAAAAITSSEAPNLDVAVSTRLAPTIAARTLDVATTGEAGVDLDNVLGTLDAADIGSAAFTEAKFGTDAITSTVLAASAAQKIRERMITAPGLIL